MRKSVAAVLALLLAVPGCTVADGLLGLSDLLGTVSDGLGKAGTCLSPLDYVDLSDVFATAVPVEWIDDGAEPTDAPQPELAAFYSEHLGDVVLPRWYLNERIYELGPLTSGQVLTVECLGDVVESAWLYDAEFTQLGAWETHDYGGNARTVEIPVTRDMADAYLRLNLWYLSETGDPIVRLTRRTDDAPADPPLQTVVLDFSGADGLTYRSGGLVRTDVAPLDDAAACEAAVRTLRETFSAFRLRVVTDQDPLDPGPASRIYVGAADPPLGSGYLGLAEVVDGRNLVRDDVAIVDAGTVELQLARLLGPEVFGTVLGKIAAHELGHLLGLWHVVDVDALMSGAGCQGLGLDVQRALDRQFKRAPVQAFTDPSPDATIGYQDAATYLLDILGPAQHVQP